MKSSWVKKWASRHKAIISTYSYEAIFHYNQKLHRIIAYDPAENIFISENTISNYVEKKILYCAIFIGPVPEKRKLKDPRSPKTWKNSQKIRRQAHKIHSYKPSSSNLSIVDCINSLSPYSTNSLPNARTVNKAHNSTVRTYSVLYFQQYQRSQWTQR